jgi:hypothetical protein
MMPRFRLPRVEVVEYVTVWNGARVPHPTTIAPAPPPPVREHLSRFDVLAALRGAADGLTMRAIADALETTLPRVNALLYGLIQDGHVVAEDTATTKRYGGQLRRYRVVTPPTLDVGRSRGAHASADVPPRTPQTKGATRPGRRSTLRAFPAARVVRTE